MTQPAASAREAAIQIINGLSSQGHTAYLAGGCVRDALLGKTPKDYDVATDAKPEQVQAIFPKSAAVGAAFGVVIVYLPNASTQTRWVTEVATFRAEGTYSDGRRPDSVRFTTAEEDAQRRDFTINGLFAKPPAHDASTDEPDQIIDYVNGRADLDAQFIRAIGDPSERFGEDYLRMLRAVRFASRLGFTIETRTSAAIRAHARHLGQISRERIGQEVLAMLAGPRPARAITLLQEHKLDAPTLNEDLREHGLTLTDRLGEDAEVATRLTAWLLDRDGLDASHDRALKRWRTALSLSNDHRDEIKRLLSLIETLKNWPKLGTAPRKRLAAGQSWAQGLVLYRAITSDSQADAIGEQVVQLADDGIGLAPKPLLAGEDLIDAGLSPGPAFKTLLDHAYDRQLEGEFADHPQAIAWLASQAR